MNSQLTNTKGVTLVEVLVTAIIGAVLAAAVVVFINISGGATDQMAGLQVLQQESSMISELFLRKVREGCSVCVPSSSGCTSPDTSFETSHIVINYPDNTVVEFKIVSNTLLMVDNGKTSNMSTRLCGTTGSTMFTVLPFGEGMRCTFTLEYNRGNNTYTYTETIGSVRCKNICP